jgi:hypothetical protein
LRRKELDMEVRRVRAAALPSNPLANVIYDIAGTLYLGGQKISEGADAQTLSAGIWSNVPGLCQLVMTGTGAWTYDTKTDAGVIATGVGSGSGADVVPIYMGGATQIRVNFPSTLTVKVN